MLRDCDTLKLCFFQVIGGLNVVGLVQKKVCLRFFVTVGSRKYQSAAIFFLVMSFIAHFFHP